jgi:N-dimethylarginine dimethylaminohydrolase
MRRLLIAPTTFEILPMQHGQNPYIATTDTTYAKAVSAEHRKLVRSLTKPVVYTLPISKVHLPDIVFVANGGLALPRLSLLPHPMILLPNMKYSQRQAELPFLRQMFAELGVATIDYPGHEPFEGQAELKWFDGGRKAVCGYGHRSTRKTFKELDAFFKKLYGPTEAPELLVLPLASADYYHLDVAMCEYDDKCCIIHKRAMSAASIGKLKAFLGSANVTVIDTPDSFCLNAVIDGPNMITHRLTDPTLVPLFERLTGRRVIQVPTIEFEKSGGSVRCMTLDLLGVSR